MAFLRQAEKEVEAVFPSLGFKVTGERDVPPKERVHIVMIKQIIAPF